MPRRRPHRRGVCTGTRLPRWPRGGQGTWPASLAGLSSRCVAFPGSACMEAGAAPDPGVPEGPGGVCRPRAQGTFPLQRRGSTERPGDKPPVSGGSRPVCVPGCQTDAAETCWKQNPVSCSSCCLCWGQEEGHSHVARSTPACGRLTPPDPRLRPQQDVQAGTTWGARRPDRPPWNAPVPCLSGQHLLSAQPACTRHILSRQPWGTSKA